MTITFGQYAGYTPNEVAVKFGDFAYLQWAYSYHKSPKWKLLFAEAIKLYRSLSNKQATKAAVPVRETRSALIARHATIIGVSPETLERLARIAYNNPDAITIERFSSEAAYNLAVEFLSDLEAFDEAKAS